jgi:hypothetical protein
MVARPIIIFGDGTKNFLDSDLLAAALQSNREVAQVNEAACRRLATAGRRRRHEVLAIITAGYQAYYTNPGHQRRHVGFVST